jgi:hypothetical protein
MFCSTIATQVFRRNRSAWNTCQKLIQVGFRRSMELQVAAAARFP